MPTIEKKQIVFFGTKIIIVLGITLFFALLAIFAGLGYFGAAHTKVIERYSSGYWLVDASCNITYNPFLYAFSWSTGRGRFSANFTIVSTPTFVGGGETRHPLWRTPADLDEEATIAVILTEVFINIPCNFVIILAIELTKTRYFYLCLFGGAIGFSAGEVAGSIVGFFVGALLIAFVLPRLRKSPHVIRLLNRLVGKD
jgi:hypothetical protein